MIELDPLVGMDDLTKPLRSRLLAVPSLRTRYLEHVRAIATDMDWAKMGPLVAAHRTLIGELAARDTRKAFTTATFERDVAPGPEGSLRSFFEGRSKFLLQPAPAKPDARTDAKQ